MHSPIRFLRRTYFPPSKTTKLNHFQKLGNRLNRLPSGVLLWTILGLNGGVYVLWNIGIFSAVSWPSLQF